MRLLLFAVLSLSALGCRHRFPLPYSVAQLDTDSAKWPGDSLVHYLGQPNADVAVCVAGDGSALHRVDEALVEPFVTSLEKATLTPERWQGCATRLVPTLSPRVRESAFSQLARVILSLLDRDTAGPQLIAAHEVLATRPRETSPSLDALTKRLLDLPRAKLPPALPPIYDALVTTLELDHGQLQGRPLVAADIDNTQDEALLLRMSERLPDEAMRVAARTRIVKQRIDRSDVAEVKARAAEVVAAVVATGRWAQPVSTLKLERPEPPVSLPFTGFVKQDVAAQQVTFFAPGQGALQVTPTLDLKPTLRFPVGWSKPLPLCQSAELLLVEPCIEAREVEIANAAVRLDAEGVLRLPERLTMKDAFELARAGSGLVLPVRLRGQLVTTLQVPLRFLAPASYLFTGQRAERGPAVNVVVQPTNDALLFEAVSESSERRMVIYPRDATGVFEFGSEGGKGYNGQDGYRGSNGMRGYNGMGASCPYSSGQSGGRGSDGSRGGDGGPGGPGGGGGQVSVELRCGGPCPADAALVRRLVRSRGGAGGDGGSGGHGGTGGDGGSGGNGTSCTVNGHSSYLSGGSSGSRGSDGPYGSTGYAGSAGPDGQVQLTVH